MSERERRDFIVRQAAALQVASVSIENLRTRGDIYVAALCVGSATALADALNLTDSPAPAVPSGCYAIPVEVVDRWMQGWGVAPPLEGSLNRSLYDTIAAARGAKA